MNTRLSIKDAILYAVNAVVSNPWYFVKLMLAWLGFSFVVVLALYLLFSLFFVISLASSPVLWGIGSISFPLLYWLLALFIWFLPAQLLLRFYDKGPEPLTLRLFLDQLDIAVLLKLLGACIAFYLMVGIGFLFLIVPGFYLAVKFIFTFLTLIDTHCSIREAFKKSYQMTSGNFLPVLGLMILATFLFNLMITMPIALLMIIHAYRQLNPAQ